MRSARLRSADQRMKQASNYDEWREAALAHDELSGAETWKRQDRSHRYGYPGIRRRLDLLRRLRAAEDYGDLLFYLNEGIHGNMDGIGKPALYSVARFGTKHLITQYVEELDEAIRWIGDAPDAEITPADKLDFFRRASHCYGRSALMLSGGGSLGPFHLGVARALWREGLLPDVISGASAGSVITAILGTHTDAELGELLEQDRPAFASDLEPGTRLQQERLRVEFLEAFPDMTFQEAFEHTGRMINISVAPSELHQASRLLNAITSPNVLILEAVLASCAVPGVFDPVMLAARDANGNRKPYLPALRWVDGSVSEDLPRRRLTRLYGANHFIASMINPLALWTVRDPNAEENLFSRIYDISQRAQKEILRATYPTVMRSVRRSQALNGMMNMFYAVATQDYTADITIMPRNRFRNPATLLSVLPEAEVEGLVREGEQQAWPQIEMIRNASRISRTLDRILHRLEHEHAGRDSGAVSATHRLTPSSETGYSDTTLH